MLSQGERMLGVHERIVDSNAFTDRCSRIGCPSCAGEALSSHGCSMGGGALGG
jgi:hypothetical protein